MATLATNISFQCLGLDGKPLAGGKVWTYEAGTTTPKTTYTTMQGDVPNSNPVILDQNGKAKIYLGDGSYRFRILDSNNALVDDNNYISRYVTQSEFAVFQQIINEGISQLTEVREQIDVYVTTAIGNQKGFAGGITPLNASVKVNPIYLPDATPTTKGAVKVVTSVSSTSDTDALAASQGKYLHDRMEWVSLGFEQNYQNLTGSRSVDTNYINSYSKAIVVNVSADGYEATSSITATVNGISFVIAGDATPYNTKPTGSVIVPPGATYKISITNATLTTWHELR